MNKKFLQGEWNLIRDSAQATWDRLTDDDLDRIGGQWDELNWYLQERYGYSNQDAETAIMDFLYELDDTDE